MDAIDKLRISQLQTELVDAKLRLVLVDTTLEEVMKAAMSYRRLTHGAGLTPYFMASIEQLELQRAGDSAYYRRCVALMEVRMTCIGQKT